ncbi:MAG: glycosyltransferase, partial [Gemmatimonadota bacterium]|nr:glycosyltransferase [Gemmatimonadota bacterium]
NEWTKGKCAFKAIEYMAVGIPAVCSPVGMNRQLIRDRVNGFLPADDQAWVDTLSLLVKDRDLRRKIGAAGRELIQRHYSLEAAAPRLKDALFRAAAPQADKGRKAKR